MDVIEAELRMWHSGHRGKLKTFISIATFLKPSRLRYWSAAEAVDDPRVEALDRPHECERVAATAAREFGLRMVVGFVTSSHSEHPDPVEHCWNLDSQGRVIDAARSRRVPLGYLGVELTELERAKWNPAALPRLADVNVYAA